LISDFSAETLQVKRKLHVVVTILMGEKISTKCNAQQNYLLEIVDGHKLSQTKLKEYISSILFYKKH
jgi:hypothetical protein